MYEKKVYPIPYYLFIPYINYIFSRFRFNFVEYLLFNDFNRGQCFCYRHDTIIVFLVDNTCHFVFTFIIVIVKYLLKYMFTYLFTFNNNLTKLTVYLSIICILYRINVHNLYYMYELEHAVMNSNRNQDQNKDDNISYR